LSRAEPSPTVLGGSRHFGDTGPILDLADGQDVS
jgi:hypothetical protein